MDATDALGAAYCHFLQMNRPETDAKHYSSWKDFATKNQSRIKIREMQRLLALKWCYPYA